MSHPIIIASKFNLHFPQITGTIPAEFGQLVNLRTLRLFKNKLTGAVMSAYMRLCVLLTFPPCYAGALPKELGNLVNLTSLVLFRNKFQGELRVVSHRTCVVC